MDEFTVIDHRISPMEQKTESFSDYMLGETYALKCFEEH